ncbi:MAG: nuclear transport factor 2 family protein [Terriglobales bacterium]
MRIPCLLLLIGVLAAPLGAQDESNAAIVSKIAALEKAWNQAFKLRDTRAIDALLDDGIVLVNDDGSLLAKGVFLTGVRESKSSDEEQVTPESISVHVMDGVAIATGVFRTKGVENGKPFVRRDRFADTWVKKKGGWVCVSASATPILH